MSLDSVPAASAGRLEPTLVADLVALAAARDGDRDALVETSGRRLTWADLDREVDRVATGLGDAGVVAGQRVLLAMGNRVELVTTYLAALRAQLVAVPVNPRAKVEELAWMIADSGARLVVADSAAVAEVRAAGVLVREALAGSRDVLDDDVVARAREPRLVVVGSEPESADELAFDDAARHGGPPPAHPPRPRDPRVPPLHRQHRRPAARRDAHPPRAAGEHRADRSGPTRHGRARATWCSGCCRSSTSTA